MRKEQRRHIRTVIFTALYLAMTGITGMVCAQDIHNSSDTVVHDSMFVSGQDSILIISDLESIIIEESKDFLVSNTSSFKPNPNIAWKIALVFPGFGQVYNQQYWKLPIVYGGIVGCVYAITWNNKTYNDYKLAYFDIIKDSQSDPSSENPDAWSQSWQDFSNANPSTLLHSSSFHSQLKRGKDYFRRYRDLSIILSVGFYLILVADSYVDAQMFDFDVSPDLSFRVTPEIRPETISSSRSFGLNVCMTF